MRLSVIFLISFVILLVPIRALPQAIIADHNAVKDFDLIPSQWIEAAKALTIHFAHTSHGSQIISGATVLESLNPTYSFALRADGTEGLPPLESPNALRMYDGNGVCSPCGDPPCWSATYVTPENYWAQDCGITRTRNVVSTGHYNFSMWSWCGQQSTNTSTQVQTYLDTLNEFEFDYSSMRFIYMTGHLDATGSTGNLHLRNEQVRQYVRANNKVLFDFADIERYDPDGNDYLDLGAGGGEGDGCSYSGGNWCSSWCAAHSSSPLCATVSSCAHSYSLNCNMKARAFWWLMARLAGWSGTGGADTTPPVRSSGSPSGTLSAGTTQATISLTTNENATCKYSTIANVSYSSMTSTFSTTGERNHSSIITGLSNGGNYSYYARCNDSAGNANTSDYAIQFSVAVPDSVAPAAITNLIASCTATSCALSFRSPGDDGNTGTATAYDIRYSLSSINDSNWATATQVSGEPAPLVAGTSQAYTVTGLSPSTQYYFAIKSRDEASNWSSLSNIASAATSAAADTDPPVLSNGLPSGTLDVGTVETDISLNTNEASDCRYANIADTEYSNMTGLFDTTGSSFHITKVKGLIGGINYAYFIRCTDSRGNTTPADFVINFSIADDIDPQGTDPLYSISGGCGYLATTMPKDGSWLLMLSILAIGAGWLALKRRG